MTDTPSIKDLCAPLSAKVQPKRASWADSEGMNARAGTSNARTKGIGGLAFKLKRMRERGKGK